MIRLVPKHKDTKYLSNKRFVVTCAQNNTPVHPVFWSTLLNYCKVNAAQLIVAGVTYNTQGFQDLTKDREDVQWVRDVLPYLAKEEVVLTGNVDESAAHNTQRIRFCADIDILPTAALPLSSMESYTQGTSIIIPHTKMQCKSVASLHKGEPYMMYTTGTVTLPNYIQRKTGQKAEFHHVIGALVVEFDSNGEWYCRQLIADSDGGMQDIHTKYFMDTVTSAQVSVVLGDLHATQMSPPERRHLYNMVHTMCPNNIVVHDALDFTSRNHHNINNPLHMSKNVSTTVKTEIRETHEVLHVLDGIATDKLYIVQSNHDEALVRWACEADYRADYVNADLLLKLQNYICTKNIVPPIQMGLDVLGLKQLSGTSFLSRTDKVLIHNVLVSMHGDKGSNGSKGTPKQMSNLGYRTVTGHTHSAEIINGAYVVGTSALGMDYAKDSPSSWSRTHCLIYENGKRALITMRNSGRWRA